MSHFEPGVHQSAKGIISPPKKRSVAYGHGSPHFERDKPPFKEVDPSKSYGKKKKKKDSSAFLERLIEDEEGQDEYTPHMPLLSIDEILVEQAVKFAATNNSPGNKRNSSLPKVAQRGGKSFDDQKKSE